MIETAKTIWSGLEFRKPMMLRNVEPLSENQMRWIPAPGRVSIAWQLWHIAEVEDIWIRTLVTNEPLHFPFGVQMRMANEDQYPSRLELLDYFQDVRELSLQRLESSTEEEFDREVEDKDFGRLTVRDVWMGVVTSFAWHAGQIAMTAKMLPETPVDTLQFQYWKNSGD